MTIEEIKSFNVRISHENLFYCFTCTFITQRLTNNSHVFATVNAQLMTVYRSHCAIAGDALIRRTAQISPLLFRWYVQMWSGVPAATVLKYGICAYSCLLKAIKPS